MALWDYAIWQVGIHQLEVQAKGLEAAKLQVVLAAEMNPELVAKTLDNLRVQSGLLQVAKKELLLQEPRKPRGFKGWLNQRLFRLYLWSTTERFGLS
jgi:hypothetical protein